VNGRYSSWTQVTSGVPQGSVIGPLLFLIYVNDVSEWIKSEMRMFADDTKVWKKITKLQDCIDLPEDHKTAKLVRHMDIAVSPGKVQSNASWL